MGLAKGAQNIIGPIYWAIDFTTPDLDWQKSFLVSMQKGTGSCKRAP